MPVAVPRPPKRIRSPKYIEWIKEQSCILCYPVQHAESEAHHEDEVGGAAMGLRACDSRAVPLCGHHHRGQYGRHSKPLPNGAYDPKEEKKKRAIFAMAGVSIEDEILRLNAKYEAEKGKVVGG